MIKVITPLAIFLLCGLVSSSENFRLPTNLSPHNYKIHILTHLSEKDGYNFEGQEVISVSVKPNTVQLKNH